MLKAIIVDDEAPAIELLRCLIDRTEQLTVQASYQDPHAALQAILELKPDVVFLDIDMPGMNGLELAARLAESKLEVEVVFITAYSQYAIEAFRINALHYLLKPVSLKDVKETVARLQKKLHVAPTQLDALPISTGLICCLVVLKSMPIATGATALNGERRRRKSFLPTCLSAEGRMYLSGSCVIRYGPTLMKVR